MGSFSLIVALGIAVYGSRLIKMFGRVQEGRTMVTAVAVVCTLSFIIRGTLLITNYFIPLTWIFELIYIVPR